MKYLLIITIFFIFLNFFGAWRIFAQENTQPNTADSNTPSEPAILNPHPGSVTVKTNVMCVKVGNPDSDKPSVCSEPGSTTLNPGSGVHPQAPQSPSDIRQGIIDQFGITMNGFDNQHLQWAWEKFWEVSNTNFDELVKGAKIDVTSVSNTQQVGCPPALTAIIGQFPEETAFKHILTHELGHAIRNCPGRAQAQETAYLNAHSKEGGVSYYGENAKTCTGSDSLSEDYAEMIAFYLNPGTPVASYLKCLPYSQNKYTESSFPLHYQVARDILGEF